MNWDLIAPLGEWASALAVIATLFYFARQVKEQNRLSKYNAWQSLIREWNSGCEIFIDKPANGELLQRGMGEPENLTDAEATVFSMLMRRHFNTYFLAYRAHETGLLASDEWTDLARIISADLATKGGAEWRDLNQNVFRRFYAEIDSHTGGATNDYSMNRGVR